MIQIDGIKSGCKFPPKSSAVTDEAHQLLWGGGPGDVKADVKMKRGSLQISGAFCSNKAN